MGRLTNNDRKFGPITYGKVDWNPFRVILSSEGGEGDDEDHKFAKTSLTVYMFNWVFRVYLGRLIKPEVYRRLDIEFDKETGPEKGSWKGGTTGCSFVINNNENHVQAMQGYCEEKHRSKSGMYKMKFISREVPA